MWNSDYSLGMFQKLQKNIRRSSNILSLCKSPHRERRQWRVKIRKCESSEPFSTGHLCLFPLRQACVLGFSCLHVDVQAVNHGDKEHTHISILVNTLLGIITVRKPRRSKPVIGVVATELFLYVWILNPIHAHQDHATCFTLHWCVIQVSGNQYPDCRGCITMSCRHVLLTWMNLKPNCAWSVFVCLEREPYGRLSWLTSAQCQFIKSP